MRVIQRLIPQFLKKIDHYLLINYPVLWETRVHFVIFYSFILGNALALTAGLVYPVSKTNVPNFDAISIILTFSHFFTFMVLGYYAYQQSIKRRLIYSPKEVLLRTGVYAFCTLSILGNALVFPNVIRFRVQSLFNRLELIEDYRSTLKEEYKVVLTNYIHYDTLYATQRAYYLNKLRNSNLNKEGHLDEYINIQTQLDEVLPVPSHVQMHLFNQRVDELVSWRNANDYHKYSHYPEKQKAYQEQKNKLLGYLKPDSSRVAQFILKQDWAEELKQTLLEKLSLDNILNIAENSFGHLPTQELIEQSPVIQQLHKKYHTNKYFNVSPYWELEHKMDNIVDFHRSTPFLVISKGYYSYNYVDGNSILGNINPIYNFDRGDVYQEYYDLNDHPLPYHKVKYKIDKAVSTILLDEKVVDTYILKAKHFSSSDRL